MEYLTFKEDQLLVDVGKIEFYQYETLLNQALEVAEKVKSIEVTSENIKESKKIIASVNKAIKELNTRRITIKKEIMKPYDSFAKQIKDIENIVSEADEIVRNQIRNLEEAEREEKRKEIEDIWNKRINQYEYAKLTTFNDFIENKHLNKTYSMKKVEEDMVQTLEKYEKDIKLLSDMQDSKELINSYLDVKDVSTVLELKKEKENRIQEQNNILKDQKLNVKKAYYIKINNSKDCKLATLLLKENGIEFEIIEK